MNNKKTISYNPATEELIGDTLENSIDDLNSAVRRAKAAQKNWSEKSFAKRREFIFKIRDYIADNADKIAEVISKTTGKPKMDALVTEVAASAFAISYYAKSAEKILRRKKLSSGNILLINKRSYVDRVPMGVIGIISPWNYPFGIPFHEIAMALIAGNSVVLKVATQTIEVGKLIDEIIKAAKLPDGLFNHVNIPGSIAGKAFIDSGIDKLFFTGSVSVGKELMKLASEKLLPISLELGGNDGMIVCNDANLERAVGGALWGGFSNAGQSCGGVERIYVEEKIYEDFISSLKEKMKKLRVGVEKNYNVDVGALTTKNQLETVKRHLSDAIEKGGVVYSEKIEFEKGFFHSPTIIENVNNEMLLMKEETFGPLLAIKKVKSIEEAIRETNNSNLGLTASVWTEDRSKAHKIASQLEVGAVTINDHLMSHGLAETPWGGWKESSYGRTHSYLGLEAMTQPRVVIDDMLPSVQKNMWWYPYSEKIYFGFIGCLDLLYSKDIFKKFNGAMKLIPTFLRTFSKKWQ